MAKTFKELIASVKDHPVDIGKTRYFNSPFVKNPFNEEYIQNHDETDDRLDYGVKGMKWGVVHDYIDEWLQQQKQQQTTTSTPKTKKPSQPVVTPVAPMTTTPTDSKKGGGGGKGKKGGGGGKKGGKGKKGGGGKGKKGGGKKGGKGKKGGGKLATSAEKTAANQTKEKPTEADYKTFDKYTGDAATFADAIRDLGIDSSLDTLKIIAAANGITDFDGSEEDAHKLLELLKQGQLQTGGVLKMSEDLTRSLLLSWMEDDESLTHHGVPHQEWGKRNGPPYPLSRQVKERVYGVARAAGKAAKATAKATGKAARATVKASKKTANAIKTYAKKRKEKKAAKKQAKLERKLAKQNNSFEVNLKNMSDEELTARVARLELENKYRTAMEKDPSVKLQREKEAFVKKMKSDAYDIAINSLKDVAKTAGKEYLDKKAREILGLPPAETNNQNGNNNKGKGNEIKITFDTNGNMKLDTDNKKDKKDKNPKPTKSNDPMQTPQEGEYVEPKKKSLGQSWNKDKVKEAAKEAAKEATPKIKEAAENKAKEVTKESAPVVTSGVKLKIRAMANRGMTQAEIANKLGISQSTVSATVTDKSHSEAPHRASKIIVEALKNRSREKSKHEASEAIIKSLKSSKKKKKDGDYKIVTNPIRPKSEPPKSPPPKGWEKYAPKTKKKLKKASKGYFRGK